MYPWFFAVGWLVTVVFSAFLVGLLVRGANLRRRHRPQTTTSAAVDPDDPRSPEERTYVEQFSNETEIQRLRRRCREYFDVIERLERERDALWKMYRVECSEHANAQSLLERRLGEVRLLLGRAIAAINAMRKKEDMEPLKKPADLEPYEGEPVGAARRYMERTVELCREFPKLVEQSKPLMVDGGKERERLGYASADGPSL
jgi:hypothetical protein